METSELLLMTGGWLQVCMTLILSIEVQSALEGGPMAWKTNQLYTLEKMLHVEGYKFTARIRF